MVNFDSRWMVDSEAYQGRVASSWWTTPHGRNSLWQKKKLATRLRRIGLGLGWYLRVFSGPHLKMITNDRRAHPCTRTRNSTSGETLPDDHVTYDISYRILIYVYLKNSKIEFHTNKFMFIILPIYIYNIHFKLFYVDKFAYKIK